MQVQQIFGRTYIVLLLVFLAERCNATIVLLLQCFLCLSVVVCNVSGLRQNGCSWNHAVFTEK